MTMAVMFARTNSTGVPPCEKNSTQHIMSSASTVSRPHGSTGRFFGAVRGVLNIVRVFGIFIPGSLAGKEELSTSVRKQD